MLLYNTVVVNSRTSSHLYTTARMRGGGVRANEVKTQRSNLKTLPRHRCMHELSLSTQVQPALGGSTDAGWTEAAAQPVLKIIESAE